MNPTQILKNIAKDIQVGLFKSKLGGEMLCHKVTADYVKKHLEDEPDSIILLVGRNFGNKKLVTHSLILDKSHRIISDNFEDGRKVFDPSTLEVQYRPNPADPDNVWTLLPLAAITFSDFKKKFLDSVQEKISFRDHKMLNETLLIDSSQDKYQVDQIYSESSIGGFEPDIRYYKGESYSLEDYVTNRYSEYRQEVTDNIVIEIQDLGYEAFASNNPDPYVVEISENGKVLRGNRILDVLKTIAKENDYDLKMKNFNETILIMKPITDAWHRYGNRSGHFKKERTKYINEFEDLPPAHL